MDSSAQNARIGPSTSFSLGDTIIVSEASLTDDLVGLMCYAIVIVNRFRNVNGMQPFETYSGASNGANPFKAEIDRMFLNAVAWNILRN
jgi:hypothetical protein